MIKDCKNKNITQPFCLVHGGFNMEFSQREIDVLRFLLSGMDIKKLASKLFITDKTVKHHLTSIYYKTGAKTRIELVAWFYQGYLSGLGQNFNPEKTTVKTLEKVLLGPTAHVPSNELPKGLDRAS